MVRLKGLPPCFFLPMFIFQFQYGTIKRSKAHLKWNSLSSFQFQYGTIKSWLWDTEKLVTKVFQFQYGTIKSILGGIGCQMRFDFNSSMVRLKASATNVIHSCWPLFQFQYGTIKRLTPLLFLLSFLAISIPVWYD